MAAQAGDIHGGPARGKADEQSSSAGHGNSEPLGGGGASDACEGISGIQGQVKKLAVGKIDEGAEAEDVPAIDDARRTAEMPFLQGDEVRGHSMQKRSLTLSLPPFCRAMR